VSQRLLARRLAGRTKEGRAFRDHLIAHELCAPIARVQFALGILVQKASGVQQADVATLHDEIQEMSALVNELLSFSKAGMNPAPPVTAVPLALVVQRVIAREAFSSARIETHVPPDLVAMPREQRGRRGRQLASSLEEVSRLLNAYTAAILASDS
jgi:two-component system sensor histidine kinase CpxA